MEKLLIGRAIRHLKKDKVLGDLIGKYSSPVWEEKEDLFLALVYEMIGQQLSGKVARVLFSRFLALFPGQEFPRPSDVLGLSDKEIRACGVSWAKVKYLKSLSEAIASGGLDLRKLKTLADGDVRQQLLRVRGIGPWTAEMFLIFSLHRPDVFSIGDLGLRTSISRLYKVRRNNLKRMEKIAEAWRPYRSFACRYLWQSLDNG